MQGKVLVRRYIMMFLEVKCFNITTYFQMIKEKILREKNPSAAKC